jgi:hypothetical protein
MKVRERALGHARKSTFGAVLLAVLVTATYPSAAHADEPRTWPDVASAAPVAADGANDAALVIGVEEYVFVPKVAGAAKNAVDWYTYLVDGRKVPVGQVRLVRNADATREGILARAAEVSALVKPGGTLWVVFIGHGAPAASGKEGVLVGVDAQQKADSLYARSVGQSELAAALGGKPVVMVLDACFSGRSTAGQPLAPGLQPLLLVHGGAPSSATVLTAGKSDQFAGPLPGLNRPAFSYLTLGALRGWGDSNGDGTVTAQEAIDYATKALTILPLGRVQTPELAGDASLVLSKRATERGPDLATVVRSLPTAGPSFGEGLGRIVDVPSVTEFHGADTAGGLADLDPDLLVLVQTAKRDDASGHDAAQNAAAWDAVARYPGKNGFREAALQRRDLWRHVATAENARREQVQRAWAQYTKDRAKLERLKALDAVVLSDGQKRALEAEFERVYAPWREEFKAQLNQQVPAPRVEEPTPDTPGVTGQVRRRAGLGIGLVGAAGLATGAVFGGLAVAELSTTKAACSTNVNCSGQAVSDRSTTLTYGNVSTAAFIAGGVLAATGAVIYLTAPTEPRAAGLFVSPGAVGVAGVF